MPSVCHFGATFIMIYWYEKSISLNSWNRGNCLDNKTFSLHSILKDVKKMQAPIFILISFQRESKEHSISRSQQTVGNLYIFY